MKLTVKVTDASLDDVIESVYGQIESVYGQIEETGTDVTLGNVVVKALLDRLTADPRWGDMAQRFADAADEWLAAAAPVFIENLVAREVARQLAEPAPGAMVRGKRSTRAEAIVATEVTTQLRAQFAPVVERSLAGLRLDLESVTAEVVAAFRKASS